MSEIVPVAQSTTVRELTESTVTLSKRVSKLRTMKEGGFWYRRRRHDDWAENYTLYRDKVQINRLLQRQSVNIPLMKTAVKTLLKDIDEPPILYFYNIDNDDQAEVFYNEYWKETAIENKLIIKDIVDKRQVLLFGRSFKWLNIVNGEMNWEIVDPQDILIDRYVDPSDIDTARFIIREHNYKPLSSLTTNPIWDTQAVRRLQKFYATSEGLLKASANMVDYIEKQKRMLAMGDIFALYPQLGEMYVELNEYLYKEFNPRTGEDEIWYTVTADDMEDLFTAPLEKVIGETKDNFWRKHYPCSTWGDETERTDFWSDGVCDTLRTPNKVLNAWFSQTVENRTLRNYGMNYYNSSLSDSFVPQTFTPRPWGWFPIPLGDSGTKVQDNVMHVDIPELKDDLEQMNFLIGIAEKASAATTFQQGDPQSQEITLGEVKLLLQNAQERVKSMGIYYTESWNDFGRKYIKLLEAAGHLLKEKTIHRQGRLTKKIYTRTITPEHWYTENGFKVDTKMKSEKIEEDTNALQWLNGARSIMPMNQKLDEIYKKKLLENANLTSDEINEVMKIDKQMTDAQRQQMMGQLPQIKPPMQMMSLKDIPDQPNQGQQQMLAEVGIQTNGQGANPQNGAMTQQAQGAQPALPPMPQPQQQPAMTA